MFRAVIVDDEASIRRAIRKIGQWEEHGIAVIGEASNGEDALLLIASTRPDLILMDMNMPGVDGIALMDRLRAGGLSARIIVVSGHDDFKYTKQAISHGAIEYILKPIDRLELNRALQKAVEALREERQEKSGNARQAGTERRLLIDWLENGAVRVSAKDVELVLGDMRLSVAAACVFVLVGTDSSVDAVPDPEEIVQEELRKLTDSGGDGCDHRLIRYSEKHNLFILLSGCGVREQGSLPRVQNELVRRLSRALKRSPSGLQLIAGFGESAHGVEGLLASYRTALGELHSVNLLSNSPGNEAAVTLDTEPKLRALKLNLLNGSRTAVSDFMNSYLHEITAARHMTIRELRRTCHKAVAIIESATWGGEDANQELTDVEDRLKDLLLLFDAGRIVDGLMAFAQERDRLLARHHKEAKPDTIGMIHSYLEERFTEDVTLQSVAKQFFLNKDYLSRAFKERYQMNLTTFIHLRRCDMAKELLRQGFHVQEAAERVGFGDVVYFSKLFKRYTGKSPKEFARP